MSGPSPWRPSHLVWVLANVLIISSGTFMTSRTLPPFHLLCAWLDGPWLCLLALRLSQHFLLVPVSFLRRFFSTSLSNISQVVSSWFLSKISLFPFMFADNVPRPAHLWWSLLLLVLRTPFHCHCSSVLLLGCLLSV